MYYMLVLGRDRPATLGPAIPLALHIVFMIAAAASRPHLKLLPHRRYRTTLSFLLLLFFWVFAYAFLWVPHSYTEWSVAFFLRGQTLYLVENFLLLIVLGVLIVRAQPPWKSIYRHLLGASALYILGSSIANFLIASRGYYVGLKDIPYTAAACWFVWVALLGRKLAPQLTQSVQPQTGDTKYATLLTMVSMLSVLAVPTVGVWELLRPDEPYRTRVIRLLIVLISVVLLAVFVLAKEYLANRELFSDVSLANERLRLAVESGKAVGWERDLKTGRDSWFGDLQTMFGIPSDTFVGGPEDFRRYVHPEDRKLVLDAVNNARLNHKPYSAEFRVVWPDGTQRWVSAEGKFYYSPKGEPKRMLGMAQDVTERRRAEDSLRESEQRFRLVANAAPVMIWMSGPDKLCTYFNQSWLEFTGRSIEAELGNGLADGVHPDDLQACLESYVEAFDRRECFKIEYRLRRHDGEYRWVFNIGVPRFSADGSFSGYIGSCLDISDRKLAEEALSSVSRKLIEAHEEERTHIARELHDDINQRIALVAVNLERLKQNLPAGVDTGGRIDEVCEQVSELGSDVQSLSHRLHSSKLDYLGLGAAAASFCRELSDHQKVEIDFRAVDVPKKLPREISLCLFRVLQEALQNAVKHSGSRQFKVWLGGASHEISLSVSDSGLGFNSDVAFQGQGLGLTSMKERLKLVGGEFSVDSQLDCGTTIHARVPLELTTMAASAGGSKH
jgi:PAS domain S-box-containing protein